MQLEGAGSLTIPDGVLFLLITPITFLRRRGTVRNELDYGKLRGARESIIKVVVAVVGVGSDTYGW